MLQLIIIVGVFVAVVTGCLCVTAKDSKNDDKDSDRAYKYEIRPKCFKRSQDRRGSCDGAENMNDFTSKDCAACKYWRGKLNR